jgi:hypothetical protein
LPQEHILNRLEHVLFPVKCQGLVHIGELSRAILIGETNLVQFLPVFEIGLLDVDPVLGAIQRPGDSSKWTSIIPSEYTRK